MKHARILLLATVFCIVGPITAAHARQDIPLNSDWKFIKQDPTAAESPALDDSTWEAVALPHTWNAQDGQDGGNNYYRGPGWYRRHLKIDQDLAGKTLVLTFDAANRNTDVYINGQKVGSHQGGFGAFNFDITPYAKPGNDNLLAVRVNNAHDPSSPPLSADFTFFGGLYRGVHLLVLEKLSISPFDHASPGVFLKQKRVSHESAEIEAITHLRSSHPSEKTATVKITITDAAGKVVASTSANQSVPGNALADSILKIVIDKPHLWNGRTDPYLYTATIEVLDGQGVVDRLTQPLGLRFFHVDPDKGFFLNGKYLDLHGVNYHQDVGGDRAWAGTPQDRARDYRLIEEMGCTTVRCAHYQHPGDFYALCDKGGIVVWAEVPCVNDITPGETFANNAMQQLTELIKQNFNHPSICFWSVSNEVTLRTKHPANKETWMLIQQMSDLAKQIDPSRITALASAAKDDHPVNFMTEVLGYNKYFGWYGGFFPEFAAWLDHFHEKYPNRPLGITEYGAGASIRHQDPRPVKRHNRGHWHPEQYQCLMHEYYWKAMAQRPWVWGKYIWVMFDFAVDDRDEGGEKGTNDKGIVTRDRQAKKDVFYYYKANWSDQPTVYITSRRLTPRPTTDMPEKVYSNCDSVELKLNGQSLGRKTAPDHIFIWDNAKLKPGENTLQAIGTRNGQTCTDSITITVDPSVKIEIPADAKEEKPGQKKPAKKSPEKKN